MKTLNNKLFKVIELLRFPLALAVVYLHCGGTVDTAPYRDGLNTNFSDLLCITVSHVITHVAVPSFFLISGYLYFKEGKINYSLYHAKIQKRFYTLFLPYILSNFIPFLFVLFKRIGGGILNGTWENVILYLNSTEYVHLFWDIEPLNLTSQNLLGISTPLSGPINFPLWYLRDLILLTVFSPLIYLLLKYGRKYTIFILLICYISGIWITNKILPITGVFFFSLGAYFSLFKIDFLNSRIMKSVIFKTLAVMFLIIAVYYDGMNTYLGTIAYKLFICTGVFMTFYIGNKMVNKGIQVNKFLTESSFFIYVSHFIFVFLINIHLLIIDKFLVKSTGFLLTVDYLLYPILITILCVTTKYFLQRFIPSIYSLLTGTR